MARRRAATKRVILPDAKYCSLLVAKLINCIMKQGKKSVAEKIVYYALDKASHTLGEEPLKALGASVEKVRPLVEVRSRRVGGATYQVPTDVMPVRALALAFRWLIEAASLRKDHKTMGDKLAAELIDAHRGVGGAVKKRENSQKMAEANRAFSHYNWA